MRKIKFKNLKLWQKALAVLGVIVVALLLAVYYGFVVQVYWAWFIVDLFKMPPVSLVEAAGLWIFVMFFVAGIGQKNETKNLKLKFLLLRPIFYLLIGYLIHLCI